jgi:hypothetical protein
MNKRWKSILTNLLGLVGLFLIFVVYIAASIIIDGEVYSVPSDMTLSQFKAKYHGRMHSIRAVETDAGLQTVVFLQFLNKISLPSGPAVYVFDSKGKLVDYTFDLGECGDFLEKNPAADRARFGHGKGVSIVALE